MDIGIAQLLILTALVVILIGPARLARLGDYARGVVQNIRRALDRRPEAAGDGQQPYQRLQED